MDAVRPVTIAVLKTFCGMAKTVSITWTRPLVMFRFCVDITNESQLAFENVPA